MVKNKKIPWPTKAVMSQIYENNLWGGNTEEFYSGSGSHDKKIVEPYINAVSGFLNSFENAVSVCDLGCGDFNVGIQLVDYTSNYIGVDIVDNLIERNKRKFKRSNLKFETLDISNDVLPNADCAILRQVLQHLSNTEILQVVSKIKKFKYLIVTEHIPNIAFVPNLDIITSQGIRLKKQSGVNLEVNPFDLECVEKKILSEISYDAKSIIQTKLYQLF